MSDSASQGDEPPEWVEDGHGNAWARCSRDDCDLHVCRPGKAQCNHPECPDRIRPDSPPADTGGQTDATIAATPEALARLFHETYERLAPEHCYRTRPESAVPWEGLPERNRSLMVATCREVLAALRSDSAPPDAESTPPDRDTLAGLVGRLRNLVAILAATDMRHLEVKIAGIADELEAALRASPPPLTVLADAALALAEAVRQNEEDAEAEWTGDRGGCWFCGGLKCDVCTRLLPAYRAARELHGDSASPPPARTYEDGVRDERAEWFRIEAETRFVTCPCCGAGNEEDSGFHCRMCGAVLEGKVLPYDSPPPEVSVPVSKLRAHADALREWCGTDAIGLGGYLDDLCRLLDAIDAAEAGETGAGDGDALEPGDMET